MSVNLLTLKFDLVGTLKLDASQFKGKKGEFLCLYIRRPCENYFYERLSQNQKKF